MKIKALTLLLALAPLPVRADQYYMGAGQWTCADLVAKIDSGNSGSTAQAAGFVMGFWSAATLSNGPAFVDLVEQTGGRAIFDATYRACRDQPDILVGTMATRMLADTVANLP